VRARGGPPVPPATHHRGGAHSRPGAGESFVCRVLAVVARVPAGRVATYGQVAALAGAPGAARAVGSVLRHAPEAARLPWQRVVNGVGGVSLRPGRLAGDDPAARQRALLEAEGVVFGPDGRIALA
jgi:methylated-DNA-protein-cysteine methyltransferase-like protein